MVIHFLWHFRLVRRGIIACGIRARSKSKALRATGDRWLVTCRRCKTTRRFKLGVP